MDSGSQSPAQRLRPLQGKAAGTLVIHEIYRSLQGESTFAGLPCVFVRLTACHLRCVYCDTPHAFNQGETMSLDDVVARALATGRRPRRDHRRGALAPARGLSADDPAGRCRQDGLARDQRGRRYQRGRSPRPGHPRHQDARLGRGGGERLEQPRPAQADRRGQVRRLRPCRFRLGRRTWSASIT